MGTLKKSRRSFLGSWWHRKVEDECTNMLTPDGKLVAVPKDAIKGVKKNKVSNKELREWIDKHSNEKSPTK